MTTNESHDEQGGARARGLHPDADRHGPTDTPALAGTQGGGVGASVRDPGRAPADAMKCLSLQQPWATLVAIGAKRIETRSWRTTYRGPLAIHASKGWHEDSRVHIYRPEFRTALDAGGYVHDARPVGDCPANCCPLGAIVAVCRLVDVVRIPSRLTLNPVGGPAALPPEMPERAFGNYAPGRYAWILDDVRRLPEPIPCRGALGLPDLDVVVKDPIARAHLRELGEGVCRGL